MELITDDLMTSIVGFTAMGDIEFNDEVKFVSLLRAYKENKLWVELDNTHYKLFSKIKMQVGENSWVQWNLEETKHGYRFLFAE